jgi:hypothetical protein
MQAASARLRALQPEALSQQVQAVQRPSAKGAAAEVGRTLPSLPPTRPLY